MHKLIAITFFSCFSLILKSQSINLDSIKQNVQNENSNLFYEKLIYKFKFDPTSMSDDEVKNLYYGKNFSKYKTSFFDTDYLDFTKSFARGSMKKAIFYGEKYLEKDPTNSEVLTYMEIAFNKKDRESKKHILYSLQAKTLLNCILKSGDGKTKETAIKVNSVGEEYLIANILGKNIKGYKRSSIMQKDGVIDGFTKGNDAIYFKVLENLE